MSETSTAELSATEPSTTELACSLNDEEHRERRKFVRQALLPKILRTEKTASGLLLIFNKTEDLKSDVELFIELERQCCRFLHFDLKSGDTELLLTIEGPAEAKAVLSQFISGFSVNCVCVSQS